MKKKLIVKISEGLGNQLFMYSNGYALSKKYDLDFFIDAKSGYFKKKHIRSFMLSNFNISAKYAGKSDIFDNELKNIKKKILIRLDKFKNTKKFIFEKKDINKFTHYEDLDISNTDKKIFLDGNFESEKYFINYRSNLLNEFRFNEISQFKTNKYLDIISKNNVVSITIRQNRYSERIYNSKSASSINKSELFVNNTIDYVKLGIQFFLNKIENPIFLIWSNDFTNLDQIFPDKKFIFVKNNTNKSITDFFLLTQCKYHIVGPSTFSWWAAWLSNFDDKICIRPKNLNPSNNFDFWPDKWIPV